ncbi:GNAT family N-acetyltransferase [Leifsonia sp. C5G2]|uniref:GNAT family N-acetyltransferase n=1 Tax=Leifsonia sp. C5G2 TaxID=2735269 RepID=UPI001585348D|nr:GNAT family N-acetyltransferase [Leifsonia sp. C5G2]NUU06074.1 GNAT family N-acetyltransferase [Leifsonia sp. C5G2]
MDYLTAPLDETSRAALAATGLRYAVLDNDDAAALEGWIRADFRGFHGKRPSAEVLEEARGSFAGRRNTGVYDDEGATSDPVGTVNTWPAPLTVPGGARVDSWAISSVTVAPTHRRRGIATALLGGELRTAHALGLPLAILTVSESVIYGRWGFGPATWATAWSVDTKRVRWAGGETPGRLSFAEPAEYEETGARVLDRVMASRAGEIGLEPYLAKRLIGPMKGDPDADKLRLVRYDSAEGEPEGFVTYVLKDDPEDDFTRHTVVVNHLAAATPEALRALWRFLIELDLVAEVKVWTRGVDEPYQSLVNDIRGARVTELQDHLWVRILDVPAALQARTYEQDGSLVIDVADDLGLAGGRFRLTVRDGRAEVEATEDAADVSLPVAALGSAYLGHDVVRGLALAGRIQGDAEALDRLFRTAVPPRLSTWF